MPRNLNPRILVALVLGLASLGVVSPIAAEFYEVHTQSGAVIESRYQPKESSWDPSLVLVMTEVGNWVGVPKTDIVEVKTVGNDRGFGYVINPTTIALGWSPNEPSAEEIAAQRTAAGGEGGKDAAVIQALQALYAGQGGTNVSPYSVQQFAEPSQAQGIPFRNIPPPTGRNDYVNGASAPNQAYDYRY